MNPWGRNGRPTKRQALEANKAWMDFAANAAGVAEKPLLTKIRPKRVITASKRIEPRERVNLAEIIQLLRTHPKVAFAWRMQSGLFREGSRVIKVGVTGIPDIIGLLHGGRFYGIEVKAKGGVVSSIQQTRINQINEGGGLAFVAWGVDDVLEQLERV